MENEAGDGGNCSALYWLEHEKRHRVVGVFGQDYVCYAASVMKLSDIFFASKKMVII